MLNLAIDTSSARGSIALGNDKVIVQSIDLPPDQRASVTLFAALSRLGLPRLRLGKIVVGLGPGSFSGIRVSLAAAQGIALAQKVKVIGICSAFSVARQFPHVSNLGVFADAKRKEIYCTSFAKGALSAATFVFPIGEMEDQLTRHTLALSSEPLANIEQRAWPRARDLLEVAEDDFGWVRGAALAPIYLRGPIANRTANLKT